jgi:hypothetical protein
MIEKRTKYIIHKTLESGRIITQAKENYQELIVTLISLKCSLGNELFFHMDLVVSIMQIKFGELLSTTQFIQEVINDRNEELVFNCEIVEGEKIGTHAPRTLFLEYHDHTERMSGNEIQFHTKPNIIEE